VGVSVGSVMLFMALQGVIRLARSLHLKVIPVYIFGATQCYDQLAAGEGWFAKLLRKVSSRFRIGLTYCWGPLFLPLPYPGRFDNHSEIESSQQKTRPIIRSNSYQKNGYQAAVQSQTLSSF
jgi:hypothetical protein